MRCLAVLATFLTVVTADATCDKTPGLCAPSYEPICASNGGSYLNPCEMALQQCKNASVTPVHTGACNHPYRKPVVIIAGDSLTRFGFKTDTNGWGMQLANKYAQAIDVLNRGKSAYSSKMYAEFVGEALFSDIKRYEPAVVTLWLGTNDALSTDPRFTTIPQFSFNMKWLVQGIREAHHDTKVLLISPPTTVDPKYSASLAPYAQAVVALGQELNVDVLDLYAYLNTTYPDVSSLKVADGVHFNADGNTVVFNQVDAKIAAMVPAAVLNTWQAPDAAQIK